MSDSSAVSTRRRPPSFHLCLPPIPYDSPYYLHPTENPNLQLVSPILNAFNYRPWTRAMKTALLAKNKYVFVTGVLPMPAEPESLAAAWIRCNSMVVSWITTSVCPSIARDILWLESAVDIWSMLKSRFSRGVSMRIYEIQEAILRLTQGSYSVAEYYAKLKGFWEELVDFRAVSQCKCTNCCCCDSIKKIRMYREEDCVIKFLSGLNVEFDVIRTRILLMEPLPCLESVFALVVEHEKVVSVVENQCNVFLAKESDSSGSSSSKRVYVCSYCGKDGHTVDRCFKKHGFPPRFDFVKKRQSGLSAVDAAACRRVVDSVGGGKVLSDEQYQMLISLLKPSQSTSFCSDSVPIDEDVSVQLARKPKRSFFGSIFGLLPGVTIFRCGMGVALLGPFCLAPSVMLANFIGMPIAVSGSHFSSTCHALKEVLTGQASLEVSFSTGHSWMEWLVAAPLIFAALCTILLPCVKVLVRKFNSTSVSPDRSPKSFSEARLEVRDV
ncbi:hypothetical protein M5689_016264 [Euphorbia peplus]|nr:hypothetical protein M5689_016264 [Euphorbia peplus]